MAGGRRWPKILAALGVLLVLADQGLQHTVLADGELMRRRVAPYDPPLFNPGQRASFERLESFVVTGTPPAASFRIDPDLGWAPPPGGRISLQHYDAFGCRVGPEPLALERREGVGRVLTLGCSFTLGEEVADDETWVWQLDAALPDHEFGNLAMSAYGLDQALLRYRRDGRKLAADEVWLGWLPVASLRVLTVYRPAQRHWAPTPIFKPRFRLDDSGELELLPCPVRGPADTHALLADQAAFLEAVGEFDTWVARLPSAYAPSGEHLWHRSGLARLAMTYIEGRGRDHRGFLADPGRPEGKLLQAIILRLAREVAADGAHFRLFVLPSRDDSPSGRRSYLLPTVEALQAAGIEVHDLTGGFVSVGVFEDDSYWAPGGHYSAQGNSVVAGGLRHLLSGD